MNPIQNLHSNDPIIPVPQPVAAAMDGRIDDPLPPADITRQKKSHAKLFVGIAVMIAILTVLNIVGHHFVRSIAPAGTPQLVETTTLTPPSGNIEAQVLKK